MIPPQIHQQQSLGNAFKEISTPTVHKPLIQTSCTPIIPKQAPKNAVIDKTYIEKLKNEMKKKQNQCMYCGKQFLRKWNLNEHIKIHTKEKPFECKICHKRFTQKHSLVEHTRIHSGERPFECDICHKRFRIKYNCKVHKRRHTGEKPYLCIYCGDRRFASKSGLNSHIRHIHNK